MTQPNRGGLTALAWFGAILTGCGGWVDLDSSGASGGSASGSAGKADKPAAIGGATMNPPLVNGGGGGLLAAGGADAGPAPHGLIQVLQSPPPTWRPDGGLAPGMTWSGLPRIIAGSLELGALVGVNEYCFKSPGSAFCDGFASEPFVWTEASGMFLLDHLDDLPDADGFEPQFVSADGATVVGSCHHGPYGGFFRWTKAGGTTTLGEPTGTDSTLLEHMTSDGNVVAGMSKNVGDSGFYHPFLWTVANGYQPLASFPTWPPSPTALVGMSLDGSILIGQTGEEPKQVFRWSPTTGVEELGALPGRPDCNFSRSSADAGTVFGLWQSHPDPEQTFVWTHATGIAPITLGTTATTCSFEPFALPQDGAIAFGPAQCGATQLGAVRWTAATGLVPLPAPPTGRLEPIVGVNRDGSVAFGTIVPESTPLSYPVDSLDGTVPFRWSAATGVVPLESLPGHTLSYAYASNAAGDVLIGRSGTPAGASEAVMWDGVGVVGIAAYLTTLGADLHGVNLQSAERIATRDGTTVVQGITDLQHPDGSGAGVWIAWLPQRH